MLFIIHTQCEKTPRAPIYTWYFNDAAKFIFTTFHFSKLQYNVPE